MAEAENLDDSAADQTDDQQTTIIDDKADDKSPDNVTWPDDWRKRMAGDDEKLLARAERFATPEEVWKSYLVADKKISEGVKPPELPENPTDEQLAEYREQVGIPKEWTEYNTEIGEGVVWGDDDKPMVDSFLEWSHENNVPQQYVTPALAWYNKFQQDQQALIETQDLEDKTDNKVVLKEQWGADYQANINAIKGLFDGVNPELHEKLWAARGPDGVQLGNSPEFLKAFAQIARQANPAAMIAPGNPQKSAQAIDDRIKEIQKTMGSAGYKNLPERERDDLFKELTTLNASKEKLQTG